MHGAQHLAELRCPRDAKPALISLRFSESKMALLSRDPRDRPRRTYPAFGCTLGMASQISKVPVVSAKILVDARESDAPPTTSTLTIWLT